MRYILFHNCKLLFSKDLRFEINVNDRTFYDYGKDLDKPHIFKVTELRGMRVTN